MSFITDLVAAAFGTKRDRSPVPRWDQAERYVRADDIMELVRRTDDIRTFIRGREFNVKHYGAVGNGIADDRAAIQAAIDAAYAAGGGIVAIPRGLYRVTSRVQHKRGAHVVCEGIIVPDSAVWADSYVWEVDDEWNDPYTLDGMNGKGHYSKAMRTSLRGLIIRPSDDPAVSIPGRGLHLKNGGSIPVESVRVLGCRAGGIHVSGGYEWKLHSCTVAAPISQDATAVGIEVATSDVQVTDCGVQFYRTGVRATAAGTANVFKDVHTWGMPRANSVPGWEMRNGFEVLGSHNKFLGCYADTPEKIAAGDATLANGGVGFYVNAWENTFMGCTALGSTVQRAKAFLVHDANDISILGSNASNFESFETTGSGYSTPGFVVLTGSSSLPFVAVRGGNLARLQGLPIHVSGSGTPEGSVAASVGSTYTRTDTGALYRKTSGTGSTGWVTP